MANAQQIAELQAWLHNVDAALREFEARERELEAARRELELLREELTAERASLEAARAEAAQLSEEFEATLEQVRQEHASALGEQAITYASLPLDELLTVFNGLGKAGTVPEVLTELVTGIAREFSRVALFDVRGTSLHGTRQIGVEFETDISKVVVPLSNDSLLTRAAKSGRLEALFPRAQGDAAGMIPFGGAPACALAIPVVVRGVTVAVIYADDADHAEFTLGAAQARTKYADLLQQHAALVLTRIGVEQTGRADTEREGRAETLPKTGIHVETLGRTRLRHLVLSLANQLEREYNACVQMGSSRLHSLSYLRDAVERARRQYVDSARLDPVAATFFDDHLADVARARRETAFGKDLAALLAPTRSAVRL